MTDSQTHGWAAWTLCPACGRPKASLLRTCASSGCWGVYLAYLQPKALGNVDIEAIESEPERPEEELPPGEAGVSIFEGLRQNMKGRAQIRVNTITKQNVVTFGEALLELRADMAPLRRIVPHELQLVSPEKPPTEREALVRWIFAKSARSAWAIEAGRQLAALTWVRKAS